MSRQVLHTRLSAVSGLREPPPRRFANRPLTSMATTAAIFRFFGRVSANGGICAHRTAEIRRSSLALQRTRSFLPILPATANATSPSGDRRQASGLSCGARIQLSSHSRSALRAIFRLPEISTATVAPIQPCFVLRRRPGSSRNRRAESIFSDLGPPTTRPLSRTMTETTMRMSPYFDRSGRPEPNGGSGEVRTGAFSPCSSDRPRTNRFKATSREIAHPMILTSGQSPGQTEIAA